MAVAATKLVPTKTDKKGNLEQDRIRDRKPVRGIFKFYEVPGGSMPFSYKEYDGDPVENFNLIDGNTYTIPLGVAKHLNKRGWYPVYEHVKGEPGMSGGFDMAGNGMRIGHKVRRFGFQSLEFMDLDEMSSQAANSIVTVEHI